MSTVVGYFPGCSLTSTAKEYDDSVRLLCERLGIELQEIDDWNCCGATPAWAMSEEASLALSWSNLAQAERQGLSQVLSPCPACHSHMCQSHRQAGDRARAGRLAELTGTAYGGGVNLRHLLDFLTDEVGLARIKAEVKRPLAGLRVACYYGCLTRLPGVELDDPELPEKMEQIVLALGAKPVRFSHATECCGASLVLSKTDTVLRLSHAILRAAQMAEADCVVAVCPVCQGNLDMRQRSIEKKYAVKLDLPVLYLSQLVALAMGFGAEELGFGKHFVNPRRLLELKPTEPAGPARQRPRAEPPTAEPE